MKRLILLSFALLFLYGSGSAQEKKEPFKILVEAKIGAFIGEHRTHDGTPHEVYRFENRDVIGSIQGGIFLTKTTIGGIGFRFDRIRKNTFLINSNNLLSKHRLYAGGILLFLQQNFRLQKRSSTKKKLNGFLRGNISSLNFGTDKIVDYTGLDGFGNRVVTELFVPDIGESKHHIALSLDLGLTYDLNEKTALLCQGTWETSNRRIFNESATMSIDNIRRFFIDYYFVQVGARRTISF